MHKLYIILLLAVSVSVGIIFLFYRAGREEQSRIKNQNAQTVQRQHLPAFEFYTLDSTTFTHANLLPRATVVVYFNSECDHCQREARDIAANLYYFQDMNLLMVSDEHIATIENFIEKYGLKHPNICALCSVNNAFYRAFQTSILPSIFVYDKNGLLLKHHKGETKIDEAIAPILFNTNS